MGLLVGPNFLSWETSVLPWPCWVSGAHVTLLPPHRRLGQEYLTGGLARELSMAYVSS